MESGNFSLAMSEEELQNLINDKERAKKQAEMDSEGDDYVFEVDAEMSHVLLREDVIEISGESAYGDFYVYLPSKLSYLLDIVKTLDKKINKAKTVMEGLK